MKTDLFSPHSIKLPLLAFLVSLGTANADIVNPPSTSAHIRSSARISIPPDPREDKVDSPPDETSWVSYERLSESFLSKGGLTAKGRANQSTKITSSANSLTCISSGSAEPKAPPPGDSSRFVLGTGSTSFSVAFTVDGTSTYSLSASGSVDGGEGDDDGDENFVEIQFSGTGVPIGGGPGVVIDVQRRASNEAGELRLLNVSEGGELLPGSYELRCEAGSLTFPTKPSSRAKFSVTLKVTSAPPEPELADLKPHWIHHGTGAFSAKTNWAPQEVPVSDANHADAAIFDLPANYTVTLGGGLPIVDQILLSNGGRMTLSGGTLFATSTALNAPSLIATGNARLILPPGGTLATVGAILGNDAGSFGEVKVLGGGASWRSSGLTVGGPLTELLTVGRAGTGRLTVSGGGLLVTDEAIVGGGTAPGFATITGEGSRWDTEKLTVGNPSAGGLGILDGGIVSSAGRVEIGSGASNTGLSSIRVQGLGASGSPSNLRVGSGGLFVGKDVPGSLDIFDGGLVEIPAGLEFRDGLLSIDNFGQVRVRGLKKGSNVQSTLEARDVSIDGDGFLIVEAGGLVNCSGFFFVGGAHGRGDVTVAGLSPTGIASELQITSPGHRLDLGGVNTDGVLNILNSAIVSVTCQEMHVGSDTGGHGAVFVSSSDPTQIGSSLSVTGPLKIGNAAAGGGTGLLRITDSTVAVVGDVFIAANGRIDGTGTFTVSGGKLHNSGFISPGLSPGILKIEGDFEQDATGVVVAEVGGPTPGKQHDQFIVTGNSTMGGKLVLQFINGYAPKAGDHFNVLNMAGANTGTFASIDVLGLEAGAQVQTTVNGGILTATAMNETAALPTVSIKAVTRKAFEKGRRSSALLISRKGTKAHKANPLTVNYAISGTADNGFDYQLLSGSVTIPARKNAVAIKLKPFDDGSLEANETAEFQVIPGTDYSNSLRSKAQVTIVNNQSPKG